jgi:tRNA(adenine34) deaminase
MTDCIFTEDDAHWMRQALDLAHHSASLNEVPVGAVIVRDQHILGQGWNASVSTCDSTHHAEIAAIRSAGDLAQNYRLTGSTLYVTLEPCTMCFGAMIHARIGRVVFGTREPRAGVLVSQLKLSDATFYNHQIEVEGGLLADQSTQLLTQFFQARRSTNPADSA